MPSFPATSSQERPPAHWFPWLVALVLALGLPACSGSSNSTTPTPVAVPAGPSKATVTVTVSNAAYGNSNDDPSFNYKLTFGLQIKESAGLAANINFVRMEIYSAGGALLERREIGATTFGSNRLQANGTVNYNVTMHFNNDPLKGRYLLIGVDTTDDKGNEQLSVTPQLFF
jgi:hypothetical protein